VGHRQNAIRRSSGASERIFAEIAAQKSRFLWVSTTPLWEAGRRRYRSRGHVIGAAYSMGSGSTFFIQRPRPIGPRRLRPR